MAKPTDKPAAGDECSPKDLPVPIRRWQNSPALCARFREIVESDDFRMAVATLRDAASPTGRTLSGPEADARRHAWLAGYMDAFRDLRALAFPVLREGPDAASEWDHILPPAATPAPGGAA